jgi:hypothetical protein
MRVYASSRELSKEDTAKPCLEALAYEGKGFAVADGIVRGHNFFLAATMGRFHIFNYRASFSTRNGWRLEELVNDRSDYIRDTAAVSTQMLDAVRLCLARDKASRQLSKAKLLIICPRWGAMFYLADLITEEMISMATEKRGSHVDIPGFQIDGHELVIRIQKRPDHNVATADADGNVL